MAVHGRDSHDGDGRDGLDEGSTLILAVIVMLLMSTLALAGLARTLSVMSMVGHGQRYDSALAAADAGLNDVLYRLRTNTVPSSSGWTMPTTPGAFQDVDGAPGKSYRYRAVEVAPGVYEVDIIGKHGDIAHGVRATVNRGPGFALFADNKLEIGSTGAGRFGLSLSAVLELGGPSTDPTNIGSNKGIKIVNGAPAGDNQHVYLNAVCIDDTNGTCPNEIKHPSAPYPLPLVADPPAGTDPADEAACEDMIRIGVMRGSFAGIVDGRAGDPYVCRRDVKLGAVTVVNGPLVIYVIEGTLDLSGSIVNEGGTAANLQIYKKGAAQVMLNGVLPTVPVWPLTKVPGLAYVGDVSFTGFLYAPETKLTINANQWWKGAIYAKRIEATGAPLVTLTYDKGLDRLVKDWTVSRYAEIPSSAAVLP